MAPRKRVSLRQIAGYTLHGPKGVKLLEVKFYMQPDFLDATLRALNDLRTTSLAERVTFENKRGKRTSFNATTLQAHIRVHGNVERLAELPTLFPAGDWSWLLDLPADFWKPNPSEENNQ